MDLNCKSANEFALVLHLPAWMSLEFIISILFPPLFFCGKYLVFFSERAHAGFTALPPSINSEKSNYCSA